MKINIGKNEKNFSTTTAKFKKINVKNKFKNADQERKNFKQNLNIKMCNKEKEKMIAKHKSCNIEICIHPLVK